MSLVVAWVEMAVEINKSMECTSVLVEIDAEGLGEACLSTD